MLTREIDAYAKEHWGEYWETVAEISWDDRNHTALVNSQETLYNFDKVCKSLFQCGKCPASADGMRIGTKWIELIEFKSGFKRRISKRNFDKEQAKCDDTGSVCERYWNELWKNHDHEVKESVVSIRTKAIESYVTLEKKILPLCKKEAERIQLKLIVVLDTDASGGIEDVLAQAAGKADTQGNAISSVRSSLDRLAGLTGVDGMPYYYDSIEVLSAQEYLSRLSLRSNKMKAPKSTV